MADSEHLSFLLQGADRWNEWRSQSAVATPEFSGADLCKVRLSRAHLKAAKLSAAALRRAVLS